MSPFTFLATIMSESLGMCIFLPYVCQESFKIVIEVQIRLVKIKASPFKLNNIYDIFVFSHTNENKLQKLLTHFYLYTLYLQMVLNFTLKESGVFFHYNGVSVTNFVIMCSQLLRKY